MDTSAFHAWRKTGGRAPRVMTRTCSVGADVGVRARGEVLAGYGAAVRYRYVVPGDLRGEPARSCDVCAVPGGFRRAVGEFLRQVLVLRARLGMGRVGVVLDGMKIAASNSANPTEERLARWP